MFSYWQKIEADSFGNIYAAFAFTLNVKILIWTQVLNSFILIDICWISKKNQISTFYAIMYSDTPAE